MTNVRRGSGPTLQSVATTAGVSRQTVSNVLNAPERVAPETIARVQAVIDSVNYRPNRIARSLRMQSTRQLGYCVRPDPPEAHSPVLDRFIHAVTEAAGEYGFHVLLFTAPEGAAGLSTYAELLAQQAVDGFLLSDTVVGDPRPDWLAANGVPFVSFGRTWRGRERGAWVDVNGADGIEQAVDHVYELGHRRVAFIGWPRGSGVGDDRYAGYVAACKRLGLSRSVVRGTSGLEEDRILAGQLLDRRIPPTALVCVSDLTALGALHALQERGLRPGHDVALVGFDDAPASALPGIDLSSVRQPIEDVGRTAVNLMLAALGVHDVPPVDAAQRLLKPALTIRASSRPHLSPEDSP